MNYEELKEKLQIQLRPVELKNLTLTDFYPGSCNLELELDEKQLNHLGIVHGGITFAVCDSCAGITANSLDKPAVTLSANINYIKSLKAGKIRASSQTLHNGRTSLVINVKAYNDEDILIADANFTLYNLEK